MVSLGINQSVLDSSASKLLHLDNAMEHLLGNVENTAHPASSGQIQFGAELEADACLVQLGLLYIDCCTDRSRVDLKNLG